MALSREHLLAVAGWLSAAIALLHVVIIFLGAPAYRYFGAGEDMARQAEAGSFLPAAITLAITVVFIAFALYAFAGAGQLRRPPLLRTGLITIAAIYLLRGLGLFPELAQYARDSSLVMPRQLVFSLVSLTVGLLYLMGTVLLWPRLRPVRHRTGTLLPLLLLCLLASGAAAQQAAPAADGTLVEQTPCPPDTTTYEQYVEMNKGFYAREVEAAAREGIRIEMPADPTQGLLSKEVYEQQKAYEGFECRRIKYLSDNLKVVGFLWKPKDTDGKKLPLIIFNRGGNREFGKLTPWIQRGFYSFVSNGFVVLGSQYRGNDGGEGREEFGGADVRDILNLIPLARSLGYVDMNNVFLLGWSRGGMMTALALKSGIPVNAAAIGGGAGDLVAGAKERPVFLEMWKGMIPGFETRRDEILRERSAVYWADRINVPLLLMHGGADWRVGPGETLAFAQKLQEHGKTYELIIYARDDHRLSANRADSTERTIEWFRRHMK